MNEKYNGRGKRMKLSISNIAWGPQWDNEMYHFLQDSDYTGIEIAPTRLFPEAPYEHCGEAQTFAVWLKDTYGLSVSSMQSIWYGRKEKLFGTARDRQILTEYTKKAIDFASLIGCGNLVFGCPKNRWVEKKELKESAESFFKELGDYAYKKGTVLAMEANPPIYNTNYINTTAEALALVKKIDSKGFLVNLDLGTMIENKETLDVIIEDIDLINHIHISEPNLIKIAEHPVHKEIARVLRKKAYTGYVSIEMGVQEDICAVKRIMEYVRGIFG